MPKKKNYDKITQSISTLNLDLVGSIKHCEAAIKVLNRAIQRESQGQLPVECIDALRLASKHINDEVLFLEELVEIFSGPVMHGPSLKSGKKK